MNVPKIFATENYTQKQGLKTQTTHKTNPLYQSGADAIEFNSKNVSFGNTAIPIGLTKLLRDISPFGNANIQKHLKKFLKGIPSSNNATIKKDLIEFLLGIPNLEEKFISCKLRDIENSKNRKYLEKALHNWCEKLIDAVNTPKELEFVKSYIIKSGIGAPPIGQVLSILEKTKCSPQFYFLNEGLKKNPSIFDHWTKNEETEDRHLTLSGLLLAIDTQPKSEVALELLHGEIYASTFDRVKEIISYVTDKNLELAKKLVNIKNRYSTYVSIMEYDYTFFENMLKSESPAQQIIKKIERLSKQINNLKSQLYEGTLEDALYDKTTISVIENAKEDLGKLL